MNIPQRLNGTILPAQVTGEAMASQGPGSMVNISTMVAQCGLARVVGYAAAKAAIDNVTRWLAVELAHQYGLQLRVNAVAPRFLLLSRSEPCGWALTAG